MDARKDVIEVEEKVIGYRREFHLYAESGWKEFRTTSRIIEILEGLGLEVKYGKEVIHIPMVMGRDAEQEISNHIERGIRQGGNSKFIEKMEGYTGAVGILKTGRPGPVIAIRFDIDANDVIERKDLEHRPTKEGFASVNEGMMHACGHDGHTAMGLGLAELLIKEKKNLTGTIKLIFQPAEEGVRGARAMVGKGLLEDVDYFLAGHLGFNLQTGFIAPKTTGFLSTTKMDAYFYGKGSHASNAPEEGKNSLLAAATAVLNIHAISPHSKGITRVNVGVMQGGIGRNVIPPAATLKIETRGETPELNDYMYDKVAGILNCAAKMYGNNVSMKKEGEALAADCDEELVDIVKEVALENKERITGVINEKYLGGSEDATFMMKSVQERGGLATYIFFGAETKAAHHNEGFDFDEAVLMKGICLYKDVILKIAGR
ncbi:amidohydrolase [Tindallia californiensis]|uniref:amidohydrolase n=1 Tax=Tindallia californiensis TaxID=159292 RepID=UPI000B893105|nr:amidohydrolase [Tindallia californiensis]